MLGSIHMAFCGPLHSILRDSAKKGSRRIEWQSRRDPIGNNGADIVLFGIPAALSWYLSGAVFFAECRQISGNGRQNAVWTPLIKAGYRLRSILCPYSLKWVETSAFSGSAYLRGNNRTCHITSNVFNLSLSHPVRLHSHLGSYFWFSAPPSITGKTAMAPVGPYWL